MRPTPAPIVDEEKSANQKLAFNLLRDEMTFGREADKRWKKCCGQIERLSGGTLCHSSTNSTISTTPSNLTFSRRLLFGNIRFSIWWNLFSVLVHSVGTTGRGARIFLYTRIDFRRQILKKAYQ